VSITGAHKSMASIGDPRRAGPLTPSLGEAPRAALLSAKVANVEVETIVSWGEDFSDGLAQFHWRNSSDG